MKKSKLLNENVHEIMKMQTWLKKTGEFLETLFNKIETDDPSKKDALSDPLKKAYNALWDSVDILQRNTEELMAIDQINKETQN